MSGEVVEVEDGEKHGNSKGNVLVTFKDGKKKDCMDAIWLDRNLEIGREEERR